VDASLDFSAAGALDIILEAAGKRVSFGSAVQNPCKEGSFIK
jgi:hypothetical protein